MKVRLADDKDLNPVLKVVETAFADEANKLAIMDFVRGLFSEVTSPPIKSLVAEVDDEVIGYVSFSPIYLESETKITGYILAPLGVSPNHQRKGVGSNLINEGKRMLSTDGVDVVLVYGYPNYYGRFGFKEETARPFVPPYPLQHPQAWMGIVLSDISVGENPIKIDCVASFAKPDLWCR